MHMRFVVVGLMVCGVATLGAGRLAGQSAGANRAPASTAAEALDPKLVGNRFPPLAWGEMTEAQRTMTRNVLDGPRTAMSGPFNVMLRAPVMGDLAQELGAQIRFNSTLPGPLREMAILISARHWSTHYEWNAHKNVALTEGLDPAIIDAIAVGQRPRALSREAAALYDFCSELLATKRVSDDTFAAAKAAFGEQGVTEIMFTLGYYGLVSMLLNVDVYPLPEGVQPLPPLSR